LAIPKTLRPDHGVVVLDGNGTIKNRWSCSSRQHAESSESREKQGMYFRGEERRGEKRREEERRRETE
jgi:hypothetical protein